jgi:Protein of unknown function (DUF3617)
MKLSLAVALLAGTTAWAADPTPLDLKTGEWEYTVTMQMTGLPQQSAKQMPQLTPDQLAKIPPDQRAKIEAMMKQGSDIASGKPTTSTNKNCIKKEDLAKLNPMQNNDDKSCKMTVVNSSRTKLEAKVDCDSGGNKSSSTLSMETSGSESSKFSLISTGTNNGRPMNMTVNGTGKWLSATCTENK